MTDYPPISGLHYDARAGVMRRVLPAGRMERHFRFHISASSSDQKSVQDTATTSGGSSTVQGERNQLHFGNETRSSQQNNNSVNTTNRTSSNSGNKVGNGSTVNFTTNTNGVTADTLSALSNLVSQSSSAHDSGVTVNNTPPVGTINATAKATNWLLIIGGSVAAIIAGLFFFFRSKKTA